MTPQIAAFVAPLLGALIGASVPILLGFLYYRFQKAEDRAESLYFEKREAYRDLLRAATELVLSSVHSDVDGRLDRKKFDHFHNCISMAVLYAPKNVIEIAKSISQRVSAAASNEAPNVTVYDLANAMRADLEKR